jgi:hypothetical protein
MSLPLRGHVQDGKVLVDDMVDLPNGTQVQLTLVDTGDDLDDEERSRLLDAIEVSQAQIDAGLGVPADRLVLELIASRSR